MKTKNYLILFALSIVLFDTFLVFKNKYYRTIIELAKNDEVSPTIDLERAAMQYANTPLFIDSIKQPDSLSLCIFVSEFHCQSCVDSAIMQMKSYCISKDVDFILLANYSNPRVELLFKRVNTNEPNIQFINMVNQNYAVLKCNYPLIFVYNSVLNIAEHVFVPDKSQPDKVNNYLSLIETKLLNNN